MGAVCVWWWDGRPWVCRSSFNSVDTGVGQPCVSVRGGAGSCRKERATKRGRCCLRRSLCVGYKGKLKAVKEKKTCGCAAVRRRRRKAQRGVGLEARRPPRCLLERRRPGARPRMDRPTTRPGRLLGRRLAPLPSFLSQSLLLCLALSLCGPRVKSVHHRLPTPARNGYMHSQRPTQPPTTRA